jgi:hypothetical protein
VNFGPQPDPASHFGTRPLPVPRTLLVPGTLCALCLSSFRRSSFPRLSFALSVEGSPATCFYTKPPFGIFSFFLFDSTLSTVDLSFLLSATVHINIIPRILAFLCFHTLTNSFASRKTLSPIVSSPSELSAQNTRGGGTPSNPNSSPSVVQLLTIHYYSLLLTTLCYPLYNPHLQKHREGDTLQPSNAHTLPRMAPVTSHQSPNSDFEDYRQDQRPLGGLLINVPL